MKQVTVKAPSIAQALTDVATQALIHQDSLAPRIEMPLTRGFLSASNTCAVALIHKQ
jgi:hypothetical protein